jgi:L-threonylcarbamoyladenylate synthase
MKKIPSENINDLAQFLRAGQTMVFPTETSYGLGGDATQQEVVDKIFNIKGRMPSKSLLVIVSSVAEAKKYLVWNNLLDELVIKYWPGPLTIVGLCRLDVDLAKGVVSEKNTLAIRVSANPFLQQITSQIDFPLIATSANLAGEPDIYDSEKIEECFQTKNIQPDILVDAGIFPINLPTTIVDISSGELKIIRQGILKIC